MSSQSPKSAPAWYTFAFNQYRLVKFEVGDTERKLDLEKLFFPLAHQKLHGNYVPILSDGCRAWHWDVFLKQINSKNFKAESTSKFLGLQRGIMSPNMVLKSKPTNVDEEVTQAPSISSSNKTITCCEVKVEFKSF